MGRNVEGNISEEALLLMGYEEMNRIANAPPKRRGKSIPVKWSKERRKRASQMAKGEHDLQGGSLVHGEDPLQDLPKSDQPRERNR